MAPAFSHWRRQAPHPSLGGREAQTLVGILDLSIPELPDAWDFRRRPAPFIQANLSLDQTLQSM